MVNPPIPPYPIPAELVQKVRSAHHFLVLTGAGISAESGIPTFRDAQTGLWAHYQPLDLAIPEAFQRNPRLVWEWYAWRREVVLHAQPNPGHFALATMEKIVPSFHLITQNVDNLHHIAGTRQLIEFHGNIFQTKCSFENIIVESWLDTGEVPPRCPYCNHYLRPNVVWFGESIPNKTLEQVFDLVQRCEVFFSIGTSSLVEPAASLPLLARKHGSMIVEVNIQPTPLTYLTDFFLKGPSGVLLPKLIMEIWPGSLPSNFNFSPLDS